MSKLFGKKLLCGLLAFALILGYFPGAVFAAEAEETEETEVTAPPIAVQADTLNASYVAGGKCGYYSNVSWKLYSDGTLTISGTGEMAINKEEGAPWYDYAADITRVVIESGVTDIEGFEDCVNLTSVSIADTVTQIWGGAFWGCTSLPGITIPDHVTYIGGYAFSGCTSLTGITIPASVVNIGESAFTSCDSLTGIWVDEGNQNYASDASGVLFNKEKTTLLQAPGGIRGTYSVPDGVTAIGINAFYGCKRLTGVTIPSSVTGIGYSAFRDCVSMTDVTIPYRVTTIDSFAFSGCTSLSAITIPMSVTGIKEGAFASCGALKEITFVGSAPKIEAGSTWYTPAFSGVTATAYYPAGNATWTEDKMQDYGGTITWKAAAEDAPGSIIASGACGENLTWELTADGTLTISGTGDMADYDYGEVPWFDYLGKITSAVVETGVTSIGDYAFHYCESLTEITLPDSLTGIGNFAFCSCNSLTEITLPDSLTEIEDYAFSWCAGLTAVAIPDSVTAIGESAFIGCSSLKGIWVSEGNPNYSSDRFGALLNKEKTTLIQCPGGIEKTYPVSDGVTVIGDHAFDGCTSLTAIAIPDSVTEIGPGAFAYCSGLTGIIIPDSVTSIGASAFYCTGLTSITLPDSVTGISDYMFYYCANLTEVTIPDSVTSIGVSAFEFCASLTEITLPDSLTSIGSGAFFSSRLTGITIPAGVTDIGECAFAYSSALAEITFMGNAPAIGEDAFLDVAATAYYPMGNATWTEKVMQNYGGTITWRAVCIDHQWGEWTVTTEPTCTEQGEEARTCSVCGATEKREVAALGHKLTPVAEKEPGFTEPGMKEHYVCEVCGKLFADEAGTVEVTAEELVIPQLIQVVDGNVQISEEAVDKAVDIVENGGEIRLPISDAGQVKSVSMPANALSKVAELDASLTVEMTAATVTMDTAALEAVAQKLGEDDVVTLKIAQIPTEYLTAEQQAAVKDKNVVGAISAQLLVNDQPIGSEAAGGFGDGRVTVQIPFIPDPGTTAQDYKVLYVAADGTVTEMPITYKDGCLVMAVGHFSEYVIVKTKTVMLGDINGDGKITVTDLMCLANHFAGKAEINVANSDLDGNGKVNVTDLMRLANVFAGKATLG